MCAGPMLWNMEDAADVMKWYREFITRAPEDINGFFAMMTVPPGPPFPEALHLRKMCGIVWCYLGSMEQANSILEPIRNLFVRRLRILRSHAVPNAPRPVRSDLPIRVVVVLESGLLQRTGRPRD